MIVSKQKLRNAAETLSLLTRKTTHKLECANNVKTIHIASSVIMQTLLKFFLTILPLFLLLLYRYSEDYFVRV